MLCAQSFSLEWQGRRKSGMQRHPCHHLVPFPPWELVSHDAPHPSAPSPSLSPSSFLINTVISWLLTVLFVLFLLGCLHLSFLFFIVPWPYLCSHGAQAPWVQSSTLGGALWGFPTGSISLLSILNLMFVSYLQDNIKQTYMDQGKKSSSPSLKVFVLFCLKPIHVSHKFQS